MSARRAPKASFTGSGARRLCLRRTPATGGVAAAGTTEERASEDRNVVLMPAHRLR